MATNTLDYIVSVVMVTSVIVSAIIITGQNLSQAWIYQQDEQTSLEALNLLNNLLQNTGNPVNWGQQNSTPTSFGLKRPFEEYVAPSPFTPFRLMQTSSEVTFQTEAFRNLTTSQSTLLLKTSEYLNYSQAADLLSIEDEFGFQVDFHPILNVSISEVTANPLKFGLAIYGQSGSIYGASLNASLYYVETTTPYPAFATPLRVSTESNISGQAELEFPSVDANNTPYLILVKASLGGVAGVGYLTNSLQYDAPLIPLVTGYNDAQVTLTHKKNLVTTYPDSGDVYYNATFLNYVGITGFRSVDLANPEGILDLAQDETINLSVSHPGILLIASRTISNEYDLLIMPWGITPLGLSVSYGANPLNKKTVVTKTQLVSMNGLSYHVELALWRMDLGS